jgi:hypothetical protein
MDFQTIVLQHRSQIWSLTVNYELWCRTIMAHELPRPDAMLLSRAWVCGSSLAVIAGPKSAGVWMSLVSVDCCVLSGWYLFGCLLSLLIAVCCRTGTFLDVSCLCWLLCAVGLVPFWMSLVSVDCCVLSGRYLFRGIPLGSPGILVMGSRIKLLGKSNFEYH